MAGYIGKELQLEQNRTLARITGLDPAGPGFNFPNSWYEKYENLDQAHLWYTDADFVDVIHTGKRVKKLNFMLNYFFKTVVSLETGTMG